MVIAIKLARQSERLAALSHLGSKFPHLTTWVGQVLLSPARNLKYLLSSIYLGLKKEIVCFL